MTKKTSIPKPGAPASGAKIAAKNAARTAAALSPVIAPTTADDGGAQGNDLKMRDLLGQVADKSGLRRSEVREVLELALRDIGEALAEERGVTLPGLGKLKVKQVKPKDGRRVIEVRVRQDARPTTSGPAEETSPAIPRTVGVAKDKNQG
ncbi:HU family DNA-binding protein [Pseudooceanicola sp. MF1-13]|uniref:HU family DNA-binding protein n=1 Tax=Pseudooceanicola sp. MF1-13 TaxID=3379095 RepID=UPI00389253D6